ncbi:MCE family protein [Nocardioides marmorisolisilvae]|uniref:MCE family protein n=1 Tax=Nocardioides marmorisolisilvae TaxID=1542737 RepID=A0A3N0DZW1_9ACTN|nr:MCE family protein [Nocardioides marmorisolisilvae]RNL81056.1 MCE family protein [Nocardioides marmorisolisilvae]
MGRIFSNRVLGVLFLALLLLMVWTVNAVFTQKFLSFDKVQLNTDTIGLQLPARADVKVRGVIVGQVMEAKSGADGAVLTLGIKPNKIDQIPDNVTASILPKTLFGEKYVELVIPKDASTTPLKKGDRITQTALPIEVEKVLNDIYPLLRAVQPAELNYTLNALASALEGRGEAIGENIETLNSYLKRFNPQVPALVEDLRLLSKVSGTYADVAPQIAATLRNTVKTGDTLLSRQAKLNAFFKDVSSFSATAKTFLDANGDNIVELGQLSAPQTKLLNRYSAEFPCLLRGLVDQAPLLANTFRGFVFHIDLITLPRQPRGYGPQDRQVYGADNGPACLGLPNPKVPFTGVPNLNDGVNGLQRGDAQRTAPNVDAYSTNPAGSDSQKAFFNALTAPVMGVPASDVPDLTTLLFGPLAAGTQVSVR